MLDRATRYIVERVRGAQTVSIIVNEGKNDELRIRTEASIGRIRKLTHDIALAIQDFFNDRKINNRNKENMP